MYLAEIITKDSLYRKPHRRAAEKKGSALLWPEAEETVPGNKEIFISWEQH